MKQLTSQSDDSELATYDSSVSGELPILSVYVNSAYNKDCEILPPPTFSSPNSTELPQLVMPIFDDLQSESIKKACLEYVNESLCFGSRAIRDMIISSINNTCSLHYKLESFGEMRQSINKTEPYKGEPIDGPENGPIPDIWNVQVPAFSMFQDSKTHVVVPHSTQINLCWKCSGSGKVQCNACGGDGWRYCSSCNGSGFDKDKTCSSCHGACKPDCERCIGSGKVRCKMCESYGKLKNYKELLVTRKNHTDEFVKNSMKLPLELIKKASGKEVLIEERPKVAPIVRSLDILANQVSQKFIEKHSWSFMKERIVMQRQTLRAIPNTKVTFTYRKKDGEFYVYSLEKKVYFEDYPQKCCWCMCC